MLTSEPIDADEQTELLEGRRLEGAERADEVFRLRDAIGEGYGRILARRGDGPAARMGRGREPLAAGVQQPIERLQGLHSAGEP